jgi:hypothetical protein
VRLVVATRRELLLWIGALTSQAALAGCKAHVPAQNGDTPDGFFTPNQRLALGALADVVLPPDDAPGGQALGAVPYIERLLTALDGDTPQIFAGGPYSGRTTFPNGVRPGNDFATFVPVDRVALAAWRLILFGSDGLPGGGPNDAVNGKVVGLRDLVKNGVNAAMQASPGGPVASLDPDTRKDLFNGLDDSFKEALVQLVVQAAWAAPEYGGNPGLTGWKLVHYDGDTMPLGFSIWDDALGAYRERPEAPNSTKDPGPDPEPLDDTSIAFVRKIVAFTGGKEFS